MLKALIGWPGNASRGAIFSRLKQRCSFELRSTNRREVAINRMGRSASSDRVSITCKRYPNELKSNKSNKSNKSHRYSGEFGPLRRRSVHCRLYSVHFLLFATLSPVCCTLLCSLSSTRCSSAGLEQYRLFNTDSVQNDLN